VLPDGWYARCASTKQNQRRRARVAKEDQGREVGIGRNEHAVFQSGTIEDLCITRRSHSVVSDMHSIMTVLSELIRDKR
jgi:hypothetical protein